MNELDLMSPSKVAAEYGGDKRKIAQAAQMGLLDPTVAVMAGMFIDRMRNAAVQEQQPQTTVAQDVMAPAAPNMQAAGLRAVQEAPPVERGLPALPVPEEAVPNFDGGGIVAFNGEGESQVNLDLSDPEDLMELERRRLTGLGAIAPAEGPVVAAPTATAAAPKVGLPTGTPQRNDIEAMVAAAQRRREIPLTDAEQAQQNYYKSAATRAAEAKTRAFNEFLVETGLRGAASKAPSFLRAVAEGGAGAMSRLTGGAKEAREIEESAMKGLADISKAQRLEKLAGVTAGEQMYGKAEEVASREEQSRLDRENRLAIANIPAKELQVAAQLRKDNPKLTYLESISQASQAMAPKDTYNATRSALTAAANAVKEKMAVDPVLLGLSEKIKKGDPAAIKKAKDRKDEIEKEIFTLYRVQGVDLSSGKMSAVTPPAPLPSKESELQKGVVYNTQRGPATWDGNQFIPVK